MSRTQKLNGLVAASLRLKTLNDNPYLGKNQGSRYSGESFTVPQLLSLL